MHEGVDAHDDFRNRERDDVAGDARLGFLGGDLAEDVAAFVEAGVVEAHVRRRLVAGGVLELHLRELLGHLQLGIHEAERGAEDDAAAFAGEALEDALGVRAFGDVLDVSGLNLVAEFLLDGEAALVVLVGVAKVTDRAGVDPAGLELGRFGGGNAESQGQRRAGQKYGLLHCQSPLARRLRGPFANRAPRTVRERQ